MTRKVTTTAEITCEAASTPMGISSAPATPVERMDVVRLRMDPPKSAAPRSEIVPNAARTGPGVSGRSVRDSTSAMGVPIAARVARRNPTRPGSLILRCTRRHYP